MPLSVTSSMNSAQTHGRQGYLLQTDHSFSEFTFGVYTPGYESDLILVPKSLLFEASKTSRRVDKVIVQELKPGAHVRVFFDENKLAFGIGPTGKFWIGDIRNQCGVECADFSREGHHLLKTYCAFSRDDPSSPLPRPPPLCGTLHFGLVPLEAGINPRDYDPYVFFHCLVRYEIQLHEVDGNPSKLPTASIKLWLAKVVEPVWDYKMFDQLYYIMSRCGWPRPERPIFMPADLEGEVRMKKIELTGAYPSLPPMQVPGTTLYYLEGNRLLYPKNPRQKVLMGMMTRAAVCRSDAARYSQGPVQDGGRITATLIYYEIERFYVVWNYNVHHEPESRIPVRPSLIFGENEYQIKIYAPEKFPGFYAGVGFGSILIEDPLNLLFGKRMPPGEAINVWTRPNDHEKVAKLRISSLDAPGVAEPIEGTGFLVNPSTGSFYCADLPRQRIYLTERLRDGVEVGEFITFKASYNAKEGQYAVDEWRKAMKFKMQVHCTGSKYTFKERLLATRLISSKRCVRGETLGLITDKEDQIYKWCFDKNAEMPNTGLVHAYVEENTDPERCTFFNIHSFDWELEFDRKTKISAAVDRRPGNDDRGLGETRNNETISTGWGMQAATLS